jgi:hypothetical protein
MVTRLFSGGEVILLWNAIFGIQGLIAEPAAFR